MNLRQVKKLAKDNHLIGGNTWLYWMDDHIHDLIDWESQKNGASIEIVAKINRKKLNKLCEFVALHSLESLRDRIVE